VLAPKPLKAIVLDVDGTLYRQSPLRRGMLLRLAGECLRNPVGGWKAARLLQAYRHSHEELRGRQVSNLADEQLRMACSKAGADPAEARKCLQVWFEEAPLPLLGGVARPGLHEFLQKAQAAALLLAVFSDYPAHRKLEAMGVSRFFSCVHWAQQPEIGELKPSPKGIQAALRSLGVDAADAIYVGDRPGVDGEAARRAGLPAVIVGVDAQASGDGWTGVADFHVLGRLLGL
jgi:putative hydrolase of the HAD superfamily